MVTPVSYAERARRAQNIRSPIAAPPPNISPARLASNTSNASAASVTNIASPAAPSGAVSASFSATTDDSSIAFATQEPSLTPPPTVSKSQPALANFPAVAARSPSPELAAKALSIVAAHTAPSLGSGKSAPTVNVWSQRIERMAAARAAAAATAPAGPTQSASAESLPVANGKATRDQLRDEGEQQPSTLDVAGTAKSISTSASTSTAPATSVSLPNLAPISAPVLPPPSPAESLGEQQAARELVSADAWPEVGKSVLADSGDSLRPSDSASTSPGEIVNDGQEKGSKSNTKSKAKSKWVPIPAAELQAAADAAVAARKPTAPNNGGQRKGSRSNPNTQPSSTGTTDVNNSQANTSANNTPRSQSGRTSAVQSRAQSAQNSPRVARGRRLPLEEGLNGVVSDAGPSTLPRPAPQLQLPQHAIQSPPQIPYPAPHYSTPGHTPTPEATSAPFPRHQSHPMQPAGLPSPAAHAFQVSAAPFYPHQPHMPPAGEGYAPLPGAYGYPIYARGPYGYGSWQGPQAHGPPPGPPYGYPPPPPQQQQPAPYIPLGYASDGQTTTTAPPPPPPPGSVPALHVDVAPPGGGEVQEKGEFAPSVSANALREKMMFGSIDSPLSVNGHAAGAINGVVIENGQVDVVTGKEEYQGESQTGDSLKAAKDGKGKGSKGKAASATWKDRENVKEGGRQAGRAHTIVPDDGADAIPAVQASQSMQAEIRWKFGTASSTPPVQRERVLPPSDEAEKYNEQQQPPAEVQASPMEGGLLRGSNTMPAISGANTDGLASFAAALDLRGSASFAHLPPHPHPLPQTDAVHPPVLLPAEADPDLAVKDYGFGFGAASGSGYTALAREERLAREREFEAERAREALWNVDPSALMGDTRMPGLGDELLPGIEAGSSHAGYGLPREPGYGRGVDGLPPLGRGGRRGAFGPGLSVRGYGGGDRGGYGGRRGRGANAYSRGYGRGGYPRVGGGPGGVSHRSPPFTVTPPQHLIPLSPMGEHHQPIPSGGYYPPPRQMAPYLPPPAVNGFERYAPPLQLPPANGTHVPHVSPPVPVPLSPISFPLDHTRYYLLGQLEYYLSPQNMAQDFFLRQQMDSRGWIAISLIASFNRVKQLTMDSQLVRDVLTLSSLVQVRGSMVRMGGWESFVLPDAKPSIVEDQPAPQAYQNMGAYHDEPQQPYQQNYQGQHPQQQQHENSHNDVNSVAPWPVDQQAAGVPVTSPHINGHSTNTADALATDDDEEEDEEEEVVFVMGQDVGKWSPERVSS